jgi:hypothetical protein
MDRGPQFPTLYHGTIHPFEVGDIISPRGEDQYAWATPELRYAKERAADWTHYGWNDHVRENPQADPREFAKSNPARVYEVEHLGDAFFHPDNKDAVASKSGFRVIRRIH